MKRIIPVLLIFILALNAACAELLVNIPKSDDVTDDKYSISVDISGNTGFASLQIELFYNENVLTCEKVLQGDAVKGMLTDFNPKATGESTSAIFSVAGIENTDKDGNIATFVFEKPRAGDPRLQFLLVEMMSADGKKVDCKIKVADNYGEIKEEVTTTAKPKPTVTPSKPKEEEKPKITFTDISSHWAREYIGAAVSLGIVNGFPDGTFAPEKQMTRAEFATILWNMVGKPKTAAKTAFTDVKKDDWYYMPIAWAFENGYVKGVNDTEFDPSGTITREQAMTVLHRYADNPKASETLEGFADRESVSSFAFSAMSWAVENKIISGVSENELAPKMSATRAQLATLMVRYLNRK